LDVTIPLVIPLDELLEEIRQLAEPAGAALAHLVRHVLRYVPRPSLGRVETYDPNGVTELTFQ